MFYFPTQVKALCDFVPYLKAKSLCKLNFVWYHCQGVVKVYLKRIGELRTDHDKTQKELAEVLLCNRQVYSRYERGLREIPVSMLKALSKYYHVSADYILELTDNPKPYEQK